MATSQVNPAAANEPQTLEEIIQDSIQKFQAEEAQKAANQAGGGTGVQPQTAPPAGPEPIKLNIDNQELTFSTAADAAKYFSQRDERLRAQAQAAISEAQTKAAQAANQPPPTPDTKALDDFRRQFADRLVENPADATNYALSTALGVQDAAGTIRALVGEVLNLRQEGVANAFMARHDEYIVNKDNAAALTGLLEQRGLPFTVENLELAYSYAKEHELVKIKEKDESQQTQQFQPQQTQPSYNWNTAPPPRAPQNAAAQTLNGPNLDFDTLEQLPTSQLEKLVQRLSQAQNAGTLR